MRKSFLALLTGAFMFVDVEVEAAPATVQNLGGISRDVRDLEGRIGRQFGGVSDEMRALERRTVHQFGGVSKEFDDAKSRLGKLEDAEKAATEAVAKCGKGETLAERLRKCVDMMVSTRRLRKQVKEHRKEVEDFSARVVNMMADLRTKDKEHDKALENAATDRGKLRGGLDGHETRLSNVERGVADLGAQVALGAVNHVKGAAGALGVGFSLPIVSGDWRLQAEALGSFGAGTLGFTAIGRGLAELGLGFVLGPNVRLHIEGPAFSKPASAVFVGAGGSLGWQDERFGVIFDAALGSQAHSVGMADAAWASSLLAQVKF